ncbi:hypothetical protein [Litorilituus lipolyticus]|uniref:Uncharacterized protein n=1 Tax=Litorilituus lipolyticus TaxID=2491017 RepID=A0A502L155_9GAMM|nr:hypothetical protein [Litorilituus lipolyticus]TPH15703.1 hypothetical protein EPA86_09020 [Litorilituus lipolyticus]
MVDKNKLSKDVEEQIQSLASDVYIQVEEKLTKLIGAAIEDGANANSTQTSDYQALEKTLQTSNEEIKTLKQALSEKQAEQESSKQNFQVELTQKTINYTETIDQLKKELAQASSAKANVENQNKDIGSKLEEKLLESEQALNEKTQEVDGLNGRLMVLTEQEQSLTSQLKSAQEQSNQLAEQLKTSQTQLEQKNKEQSESGNAQQKQIDELTQKLSIANNELTTLQESNKQAIENSTKESEQKLNQLSEQLQSEQKLKAELSDKVVALEKSLTEQQATQDSVAQLTEQLAKEQSSKTELQQQLSEMQKSIDSQLDKEKQFEQQAQAHQTQVTQLSEALAKEQQQLVEVKASVAENQKQLEQEKTAAIDKIVELEKAHEALTKQVETEKSDIELYKKEVEALKDQVKVAQEGEENVLKRFNASREKQEQDNNQVRETIKFLRDENHELSAKVAEQTTTYSEQIQEMEHKLTEYRLKFEYAQKQLAN